MTRKRKLAVLIPVCLLFIFLGYSWLLFLSGTYNPQVPHYTGLLLFLPIVYLLITDQTHKKTLLATGIYLLAALVNVLSFLPGIVTSSFGIRIGSIALYTPGFNGLAFLLLLLYGILNLNNFIELHLDREEAKGKLVRPAHPVFPSGKNE